MSVDVNLNGFEGPLDLLIHLIQKNKINICEISISEITGQYLKQMKEWQEMDLEIASEFVLMASRLLEIKAKALLPKTKTEEEPEDLEKKLVRQLMEYKIFKEISAYLKEREEYELMAIYKDPEYLPVKSQPIDLSIDPFALAEALKKVLIKKEAVSDTSIKEQEIAKEIYSIEDKIVEITQVLREAGDKGLSFTDLLRPEICREEVVVILLSLLEMVKFKGIRLFQERLFFDISIHEEAC
ncbi:segregation/condensation protein A [Eubacteriaceae bacterium ES3]|nr:segregation/condensation protein A [Eubacteriaceae bacterium ES3]